MRLLQIDIVGYRSISTAISLHLDPSVTVILGANDHGKSNLLDALTHLNEDKPFDLERDLNWDHAHAPEQFPAFSFEFALDETDRAALLELAQQLQAAPESPSPQQAPSPSPSASPPAAPTAPSTPSPASPEPVAAPEAPAAEPAVAPPPQVKPFTLEDIPSTFRVSRKGVQGKFVFTPFPGLPQALAPAFFKKNGPRVELIRPQESIADAVGPSDLKSEANEFMRGIFYYAGLDALHADHLFVQTDPTMMELEKASVELNKTLKANWTQGSELLFRLVHDSKSGNVILRMKDPAVEGRLVRASQRSSGFTHFFTLKTVLYARQREHPANSYIFLFDEPGIYLHPAGQHDLLQVLDTIGRSNQVVYSTHSIFMLNKTFPVRHRLIVKTETGTRLDGKPFLGRWGPAIEALGLSLAGTILFAQHLLLTEGDSDPIQILAVLQKLISLGHTKIDLNAFSVIATENSKNADALIRILSEGATAPKLAVLVDGDEGGKARLKGLQPLLKTREIEGRQLLEGTTIEDYLPLVGELYPRAVAEYVAKLMETAGQKVEKLDEFRGEFRKSFRETFEEGKVTQGVARWAEEVGKKLGKLENPPSKIGISREYAKLLDASPSGNFTPQSLQRALKLLEWIQQMLKVPDVREAERAILQEEKSS